MKFPEFSVGEMARRSGVAISTLHFYESEGLIHCRRNEGNQRRYNRDTLRRIAFIRVAQRLGISLNRIKEVLSLLPEKRTPSPKDWELVSKQWKSELDERIRLLKDLRDDLTSCIGCGCLSMEHCHLVNPNDILSKKGPGPQRIG